MAMSEEELAILEQEIRDKIAAEEAEKTVEQPMVATEEELRKAYTPKPTGNPLASNAIKQMALVSVVVTSLIIIALSSFGGGSFVVKKDFETNLVNMNVAIKKAMNDVTASQNEIKGSIENIPSYVTDTVSGALKGFSDWSAQTDASIASINQQLPQLTSRVDSNDSNIANSNARTEVVVAAVDGANVRIDEIAGWQTQVDNSVIVASNRIDKLETLVADLEAKIVTEAVVTEQTSPIEIRISNSGGMLVASDNNTLSAPIKFTLTKAAGREINDIVVFVELQTEGIPDFSTVSLSGGGVSWRAAGWQSSGGYFYSVEFMNTGWGLDMTANDTKKNIYTTLVITGSGYLGEEYFFDMEATVDDWE